MTAPAANALLGANPYPRLTPMPLEKYLAIDAWQASTIKAAERSMKKAWHGRTHSKPATKSTTLGSASHTATLEPDRFALDCAVYTESKTTGEGARKKWQAFQEANAGRNILDVATYDAACRMRDSVRNHPVAGPYFAAGIAEHVLTWRDPSTGVLLKMRPDWIPANFPHVFVSLKTTRAVDPFGFGREIAKYAYHRAESLYQQGFKTGLGETREPVMVAVENVEPYETFVYTIRGQVLSEAWGELPDGGCKEHSLSHLLTKIAGCERKAAELRAAGLDERAAWPGGCREVTEVPIPSYVPGAAMGVDFVDTDPADDVPLEMED